MSGNGKENNSSPNGKPWSNGFGDWENWEREYDERRKNGKAQRVLHNGDVPKTTTITAWTTAKKAGKIDDGTLFGLFTADMATELVNLLVKKQADYGPNSIQNAPYGPMEGLITRLHDKLSRAANITSNSKEINNESLRETFLDIAGYGLIGLLVIDGKFPKATK